MHRVPSARLAAAVVLASGAALSTQAQVVLPDNGTSLWQILDNNGPYAGSFQVGDKLFDFTGYDGGNHLADQITIKPVIFDNPLDGIGFDIVMNLTFDTDDLQNPSQRGDDGAGVKFNLDYTVTVLDPTLAINCALLGVKGTASGNAHISVSEDYVGTGVMDWLMIQDDASGNEVTSTKMFDPVTTLDVNKHVDIFVGGDDDRPGGGGDDTSSVHIEYIRQTFSQIPSPGTAVVFGAFGLAASRRRR